MHANQMKSLREVFSQANLTTMFFSALIFGYFFFLVIMLYCMAILSPLSFLKADQAIVMVAIMICSLASASLIMYFKTQWTAEHYPRIIRVGSLLIFPLIANGAVIHGAGFGPSAVTVVTTALSCALFGIGLAAVSTSCATRLSSTSAPVSGRAVGLGALLAVIAFFLIAFPASPVINFVEIAIVCVLGTALVFALAQGKDDSLSERLIDESKIPRADLHGELATAVQVAVYGFVLVFLLATYTFPTLIGMIVSILVASLVFALVNLVWRRGIDIRGRYRITMILTIIGLVSMQFFDSPGKAFCSFFIITTSTFYYLTLWMKTSSNAYSKHLHPFRRLSFCHGVGYFGLLGGVGLGLLTFSADYAFEATPSIATAFLIILSCIIFLVYSASEGKADEVDDGTEAGFAYKDEVEPSEKRAARFGSRCDHIADKYKLTRRESEVFVMLAKGRNAHFVQQELTITSSTAKTHIYNIYRKLGINTQQQLIDLIDESD